MTEATLHRAQACRSIHTDHHMNCTPELSGHEPGVLQDHLERIDTFAQSS